MDSFPTKMRNTKVGADGGGGGGDLFQDEKPWDDFKKKKKQMKFGLSISHTKGRKKQGIKLGREMGLKSKGAWKHCEKISLNSTDFHLISSDKGGDESQTMDVK